MNGVWQKAADRIRDVIGQVGYETWIQPLKFISLENSTATLEAPNKFFREWISERYLDLLRTSIANEAGEPIEIKLALSPDRHPVNNTNGNGGNGNGHAAKSANGRAAQAPPSASDTAERRGLH